MTEDAGTIGIQMWTVNAKNKDNWNRILRMAGPLMGCRASDDDDDDDDDYILSFLSICVTSVTFVLPHTALILKIPGQFHKCNIPWNCNL